MQCGGSKKHPQSKCRKCHFEPTTDREKAQSIILSPGYQIDEEYFERSPEELRAIGESISNGIPYVFDETEIKRLISYAHEVARITPKDLFIDLVKWLWKPLLILIAMILFIYSRH